MRAVAVLEDEVCAPEAWNSDSTTKEEEATQFDGDGIPLQTSAGGRDSPQGDGDDDDFDYAFEGGTRANQPVFVAPSVPLHLVTNVRDTVLEAVAESGEDESFNESNVSRRVEHIQLRPRRIGRAPHGTHGPDVLLSVSCVLWGPERIVHPRRNIDNEP